MKISEILVEQRQIDESVSGMMKRAGLKLASKVSTSAKGKLSTANRVESIKKQYSIWLGRTGQTATAETLIQFLDASDYPTDSARQVLNLPTPQPIEPSAPAAGSKPKPRKQRRRTQKTKPVAKPAPQPVIADNVESPDNLPDTSSTTQKLSQSKIEQAIAAAVQDVYKLAGARTSTNSAASSTATPLKLQIDKLSQAEKQNLLKYLQSSN